MGILSCEWDVALHRIQLLNPGERLDIGDRIRTAHRPPLFDSPVAVGFQESRTGGFFASDCFGGAMSTAELAGAPDLREVPDDERRAAQPLWVTVDSPWVAMLGRAVYRRAVDDVRALAPGSMRARGSSGTPTASWRCSTHRWRSGPGRGGTRCSPTGPGRARSSSTSRVPPHRRATYTALVDRVLRPGGRFGLVCFRPEGGSGLTDQQVYGRRSLGGGLGYSEDRLRALWGRDPFSVLELRQMLDAGGGAAGFGADFLWAMPAAKAQP